MKLSLVVQQQSSDARRVKSAVIAVTVLLAVCCSASATTTITGLVGMNSSSTGGWPGPHRWNTYGGDNIVNCFVTSSGFNGAFLNGPMDAQVMVFIPLSFGTSTFTMFAPEGHYEPYHALNIFFNGNNMNPGISVFAATQMTVNPPYPSFFVDASTNSQALAGQTVPAANSLVFKDDTSIVTLTDFHWADPSVYALDRVGYYQYGGYSAYPDGQLDRIAQFTLNVAAIPEPETWVLAGIGMLTLVVWRLRQRSQVAV